MSWEILIGVLALLISLISLTLVVVFYFKADKLYKEMRDFVAEIRTYTAVTHKDTFDMLKQGWGHLWDKETKVQIEEQAQKEKDNVKKQMIEQMSDEIEKVRSLANEGVKKESLESEISDLKKYVKNSVEEMYQRIRKIDHDRTKKAEKSLSERITEIIMKQGEIERSAIRRMLRTEFGVTTSDHQVEMELLRLYLLGIAQFGQKDGKAVVYRAKTK